MTWGAAFFLKTHIFECTIIIFWSLFLFEVTQSFKPFKIHSEIKKFGGFEVQAFTNVQVQEKCISKVLDRLRFQLAHGSNPHKSRVVSDTV
jgi:hypothetical protein